MSLQNSTFWLPARTDSTAALPRIFLACCQCVLHSAAVADADADADANAEMGQNHG